MSARERGVFPAGTAAWTKQCGGERCRLRLLQGARPRESTGLGGREQLPRWPAAGPAGLGAACSGVCFRTDGCACSLGNGEELEETEG